MPCAVWNSRTPVVAEHSRRDLDEVFSLRTALERLAVEHACQKATPRDWEAMQQVIDTISAYVTRGISVRESAELDLRFHDLLYQASGHQRLIMCWSDLRPQIHVFLLRRHLADTHFQDVAAGGHQAILDALKSRDEVRAVAVMDAHLLGGYQWAIAGLDRHTAKEAKRP
jgi:DNA-binding GntR family transcriptional regulator